MWDTRMSKAALLTSLVMAACGGSASESPWPVEPLDSDADPAGEKLTKGNVVDTRKLPDNYSKKAGAEAAGGEAPSTDGDGGSQEPEGGGEEQP